MQDIQEMQSILGADQICCTPSRHIYSKSCRLFHKTAETVNIKESSGEKKGRVDVILLIMVFLTLYLGSSRICININGELKL